MTLPSFPPSVIELRDRYEAERGKRGPVLSCADQKRILSRMAVEDDENIIQIRKLLLYFVIDLFLLSSTKKNPMSKL